MTISPTISINQKMPFRTPQSNSGGNSSGTMYNQAVNTAGKVAEHGVSLFAPAAEIISGAVALFLGLVAEYALKDSILDKMSKVISFLGLGSIAVGGWGLFKYIKKQTTPPEAIPTGIEPSNAVAVKTAETALTQVDKNFSRGYDGANTGAIFTGNQAERTLERLGLNLLDSYLSPEVVSIVNSHSSGPEPLITGISEKPLPLKDLRERVTALLAFVRPGGARTQILGNLDIVPDYQRMVPDDFTNAYRIGRAFVENYDEDRTFKPIADLPVTEVSLRTLITNFTEAGSKTETENLNTLQFTLDNLEALKKIINTVVSPSGTDSKALRNLSVVKQGLICAFGLEGVDGKDINARLLEVLRRPNTGVEARLTEIKNKFEALKTVINDPKFPLQKRESGTIALNENIRDIKQNEFILRVTSA